MNLIKFFKKNYAFQNLKKSKGILAIMLLVIPVITLFCLYAQDSSNYSEPYEIFVAVGANFFGMIIIPYILSNVLFGYVYKRNSIDFINAMPINRKNLYLTNIVVGTLYIIILQLLTFLLSSVYIVTVGDSLYSVKLMFDLFLAMSLAYTFLFVSSCLALTVSGNKFTQIVVLIIVLFTIPFVRMVNFGIFVENTESIFIVNNNGVASTHNISREHVFAMPLTTFVDLLSAERTLEVKSTTLTIGLMLLYGYIGLKLFEKRKMENTGNSFESEKIHLFVKGITLYPAIVVLKEIFDELDVPQFLLIVFLMFVYYIIYDLITSKKVKLKTTLISFVTTSICLVLVTIGLSKIGSLTHESKKYYYANEITGLELKISQIFYGDMCYGRIEDKNLRDAILEEVLRNESRYNSYSSYYSFSDVVNTGITKDIYTESVKIKCEFEDGKEVEFYGTVSQDTYRRILEYILSNENYINELVKDYKISKNTILKVDRSSIEMAFVGRKYDEFKNAINAELKECITEKIKEELNIVKTGGSSRRSTYSTISEIRVYEYDNFQKKDYTIEFLNDSELANIVYKEINKRTPEIVKKELDDINKDENERYDYSYTVHGNVVEYADNGNYKASYSLSNVDIRLLNEYLSKYNPEAIDVTKPYYQIVFYSLDTAIFINDLEEFEKQVSSKCIMEATDYYYYDNVGEMTTVNVEPDSSSL